MLKEKDSRSIVYKKGRAQRSRLHSQGHGRAVPTTPERERGNP